MIAIHYDGLLTAAYILLALAALIGAALYLHHEGTAKLGPVLRFAYRLVMFPFTVAIDILVMFRLRLHELVTGDDLGISIQSNRERERKMSPYEKLRRGLEGRS